MSGSTEKAKSPAGKKPRPRNFVCLHPGCEKKFRDSADLLRHSDVHTDGAYTKSLALEFTKKLDALLSGPDPPLFCKIPLSHGYGCDAYTIVSPGKYDNIREYSWHFQSNGYAVTNITDSSGKHKIVRLHSMLVETTEGEHVDHEDQNKLNNTTDNLRAVSRSLNARNSRQNATNTSGYTGVYFDKRDCKWKAQVKIDGKNRHLGLFENTDAGKVAATEAYDMAVVKQYPNDETARINFPDKRPEYLQRLEQSTDSGSVDFTT
jgi:hypothetical protein